MLLYYSLEHAKKKLTCTVLDDQSLDKEQIWTERSIAGVDHLNAGLVLAVGPTLIQPTAPNHNPSAYAVK